MSHVPVSLKQVIALQQKCETISTWLYPKARLLLGWGNHVFLGRRSYGCLQQRVLKITPIFSGMLQRIIWGAFSLCQGLSCCPDSPPPHALIEAAPSLFIKDQMGGFHIKKKNWHALLEHVANSSGFPKGSNTFIHCSCSPFLQNKALFHQFSLKENWLQHRGTVTETEESEYGLNKALGQVEQQLITIVLQL